MQVPGQKSFGAATTFTPIMMPPMNLPILLLGGFFALCVIDVVFFKKRHSKKLLRRLFK